VVNKTKAAISYSGGKDSALALYRAKKLGYQPVCLLTTYNADARRSWFHGVPTDILNKVSELTDTALELVPTGQGDDYGKDFEAALERLREKYGVGATVFGDIDLQLHYDWDVARCSASGLEAVFPLWHEDRRELVFEMIDSGFKALITIVNTEQLSERFLGKTLTRELAEQIATEGADICGENGEYHSFIYDGPIFRKPVNVKLGDVIRNGIYSILPLAL
jgi:uncharacterized protein (TIGR00290 family)